MTNYEFKYNKKIGFTTLRNYYTSDFSSCDLNKLEQLLKTLYNAGYIIKGLLSGSPFSFEKKIIKNAAKYAPIRSIIVKGI